MTGPNLTERLASLAFATSLHVALGFALVYASGHSSPGSRKAPSQEGNALVVTLLPLDEEEVGSQPPVPQGEVDSNEKPLKSVTSPVAPNRSGQAMAPVLTASANAGKASAETSATAVSAAQLTGDEARAWQARLQSHLARYRLYPQDAAQGGREGVVLLHFVATRGGKVEDAWIESSSGISDIDRETVAAILRAQPLPPFPDGWPDRLDLRLPVTFRLG